MSTDRLYNLKVWSVSSYGETESWANRETYPKPHLFLRAVWVLPSIMDYGIREIWH